MYSHCVQGMSRALCSCPGHVHNVQSIVFKIIWINLSYVISLQIWYKFLKCNIKWLLLFHHA